jgi:putative ABC transport system permease protein
VAPGRLTQLRNYLRRRGLISLLAVLGVAIGVANIIALISVTDTARRQTFTILREMGADTVFVMPYIEEGQAAFMAANASAVLPAEYFDIVAGVPEVDALSAIMMLPGHVSYGDEKTFTLIEGTSAAHPQVRGHVPDTGRYFTEQEVQDHARVVCLGFVMADKLGIEGSVIGSTVQIRGEDFEVVGVMDERGMAGFNNMDDRVYLPLTTAQELFDVQGLHVLLARATRRAGTQRTKSAVEGALLDYTGLDDAEVADFTVSTVDELTGLIRTTMGIFRMLLYGISSVALLVAGIGIMNVMLMQVIERTREIGVRRATGARRRDIWLQFFGEAVSQSVWGAVLGCLLGVVAAWIFCLIVDWRFYLSWWTVALAWGVALTTGVVFGVFPAISAARLKPIDCLRYE